MSYKLSVPVSVICLATGRLAAAAPVFAQEASTPADNAVIQFLPATLLMFLPVGLLLLTSSSRPAKQAPVAAITMLVVWSVAALSYFAVGFAFNFGGIAQVLPHPDFAALYWEWYPLDQSVDVEVARLWGVIALQGWALSGAANRETVMLLFLSHVSLVGAAAMIPAAVLVNRGSSGAAVFVGILTGSLVYPIAANWLWGGGWLSNVGASLNLGHGLVDFGGAGVIFLAGSGLALAALLIFRPANEDDATLAPNGMQPAAVPAVPNETALLNSPPMPAAHLPILSTLGGGLLLLGWLGLASGLHNPTALNFLPAQAATAGVLAGLGAALTAAGYSWFTTQEFNPLMAGRGLSAGIVVAAAGAPFLPLWLIVVAGLVMGLLLPPLIYLFDEKTALRDHTGTVATFGLSSLLSLLLVGLAATGQAGQGWNRMGLIEFAGVEGQGVTGLLAQTGFVPDWPGQLQAQLLGAGVILLWSLVVGLAAFYLYRLIADRRAVQPVQPAEAADLHLETEPDGVAVSPAMTLDE